MKRKIIITGLLTAIGLILGWIAEYHFGFTDTYSISPGIIGATIGIIAGQFTSHYLGL